MSILFNQSLETVEKRIARDYKDLWFENTNTLEDRVRDKSAKNVLCVGKRQQQMNEEMNK